MEKSYLSNFISILHRLIFCSYLHWTPLYSLRWYFATKDYRTWDTVAFICTRNATSMPHGLLSRYVTLRMRRECRDRFPRHRGGLAIPKCITAHAWRACRDACRDRGFVWSLWRGKHSRRMRNPQFYVSGKSHVAVITGTTILVPYHPYQVIIIPKDRAPVTILNLGTDSMSH